VGARCIIFVGNFWTMEELNNAELFLLECGGKTDINGVAGKPLAAVVKVEVLKIAPPYT
jgi:hypothetical protein